MPRAPGSSREHDAECLISANVRVYRWACASSRIPLSLRVHHPHRLFAIREVVARHERGLFAILLFNLNFALKFFSYYDERMHLLPVAAILPSVAAQAVLLQTPIEGKAAERSLITVQLPSLSRQPSMAAEERLRGEQMFCLNLIGHYHFFQ
ncbi:hypothetical protein Y032_0365g3580 [Ancylostoma ceylanicum]|uniref:Uncharacterized protein n=1 Tax=Ancylostoma ceylanicum TaxID=53326 RepID=A0A016RV40_9BILA|nr:hypothetical protein Y032_0365g3580 [Ancylostoma ceylanicum]